MLQPGLNLCQNAVAAADFPIIEPDALAVCPRLHDAANGRLVLVLWLKNTSKVTISAKMQPFDRGIARILLVTAANIIIAPLSRSANTRLLHAKNRPIEGVCLV